MSQRLEELQMRRRALLLRSERLREEIAAEQQVMLDALSGIDRAVSTARRLAPPLMLVGGGCAPASHVPRRSRRAAGAGLAVKALFWVSMAKRALALCHLDSQSVACPERGPGSGSFCGARGRRRPYSHLT